MTEAGGIILAALIAAIVASCGWWFEHRLARQRQALESALAFVGRQLADLYAPLYSAVGHRSHAESLYGKSIGRRSLVNRGQPPPRNADIGEWYRTVVNVMLPINGRIEALLSTRADLIEGSAWPESYEAFRAHHHSWAYNCARVSDSPKPTEEELRDLYLRLAQAPWPPAFSGEVVKTFSMLKERQTVYLSERSLPNRAREA